jgi:hypothetical protein
MVDTAAVARAAEGGRKRADAIVNRSAAIAAAAGPFMGYLIAEGDSWFDYPAFQDIVEALENDYNYDVRSAAHHGDTVTSMAYEPTQLLKVHDVFKDLADDGKRARAILVSGAGNDVVDSLFTLLNHAASGLPPVNESVVEGVLREQVTTALVSLLESIGVFSKTYFGELRPIVIHGYSSPVPDGRGYPLLGLSGPWLKPVFARRGYVTADPQPLAELERNRDVMASMMKVFNDEVLPAVATTVGAHVHYVDVRAALTSVVPGDAYKASWRDEMHATKAGFKAIADLISKEIVAAAPTLP